MVFTEFDHSYENGQGDDSHERGFDLGYFPEEIPQHVLMQEMLRVLTTPEKGLTTADIELRGRLEAALRHRFQRFEFIDRPGNNLTQEDMDETVASYNANYDQYAANYELNREMIARTRQDYLNIFLRLVSQVKKNASVLILGSGAGRDSIESIAYGFRVTAIDAAKSMAESTRLLGNGGAQVLHDDFRKVNNLMNTYEGILAESVLEHVNHSDVYDFIDKAAHVWLESEGILLIRLRFSDSGKVFVVYDSVGKRSFTSWREDQIEDLVEFAKENFEIIEQKIVAHKENRPGFYTLIMRRK